MLVALVIGLLFVVEAVAILVATSGHPTYPLDDPYIHLALSDRIRHGHYGINPGEVATPSSSVLWPFLLAPTAGTVLHAATPLAINLVATLATGWLLLRLLADVTDGRSRRRPALAASLVAGPLLLLNWGAVAFTGMEHSAHITASLAVGVGLVEVACTGTVPWWLVAGLVLGPSLRYEGLAVTVAGAAVLCWEGRRRTALLAVPVAVLPWSRSPSSLRRTASTSCRARCSSSQRWPADRAWAPSWPPWAMP
ncbi:hypothetical protein [Modestobacter altitudinis]|uniref:hypothetical protein n=1 Tax=Modestobacter altitudinis TaxID=2213158 RepID=UPI00110D08C7|nr:hypothetical protein [Modestobacter altitudinis]